MNGKTIGYWLATALFSLALGAGGLADVMLVDSMRDAMSHLGYPMYFAQILGTWKILGVLALLAPGLPRLKEWAYAGFVFNLTGASLSHAFSGDAAVEVVIPLVLLGVAAASYALRPASRRLKVV